MLNVTITRRVSGDSLTYTSGVPCADCATGTSEGAEYERARSTVNVNGSTPWTTDAPRSSTLARVHPRRDQARRHFSSAESQRVPGCRRKEKRWTGWRAGRGPIDRRSSHRAVHFGAAGEAV